MTTSSKHPVASTMGDAVPVERVERELARRLQALQGLGDGPVQRACMSNLVIFCNTAAHAEQISAQVPKIVAEHPCRVLLLVAEPGDGAGDVTAKVCVRGRLAGAGRWMCSEQVTLHAKSRAVERLPFALRALLISDLPTNVWWAVPQPPPLAGPILYDLCERAQQIIYDSIGWLEPARGVVATASWLHQLETDRRPHSWRVASDLNWRRLKYWRRFLSQTLAPATAPGALESITEILVEHGPHAVIQSWELVSWIASRLGWRVKGGRIQPNVEIAWQVEAPHGSLLVRIHRLAEGPSEIRRVRIIYGKTSEPTALNCVVEDPNRLSVTIEGTDAAPRTINTQSQSVADLVSRQLSDRERDPVFQESMRVAQVFAQSVVG